MNEPAVRLEEQIISLFSNLETELYQGWILKQTSRKAVVYPLYGASLCRQDIIDRIKMFEEISHQKHLSCEFRIVEHTNYYLASLLEDNGYKRRCHIIAEQYVNEWFDMPDHNESTAGQERKLVLNKVEGTNVTEKVVTNNGSMIGIVRHELLYLPNGKLSCEVEIDDIFQFAAQNQVSKIIVDIPDDEKLLASYRESGFHKAYLYRCYQKEDL